MTRAELIELLVSQTGGLRPDSGTAQAELTDLRTAMLRASNARGTDGASPGTDPRIETGTGVGGEAPRTSDSGNGVGGEALRTSDAGTGVGGEAPRTSDSAPGPGDEALHTELDYLVGRHLAADAADGPAPRLVRRTSPHPTENEATPDWAVAARPDRRFGPFREAGGRRVWFDLYLPWERRFLVRLGATGPALAVLPRNVGPDGEIPAGTVWVAARRLVSTAPADGWVGLRVTGGTLGVEGGSAQLTPGQLTVNADSLVTLTLELERTRESGGGERPPTADEVPAVRRLPGAEAEATGCALPTTAVLRLDPDGSGTVGDLDASLTVYGHEVVLSRRSGGARLPEYSRRLRRVLVPLAAAPERLTVSTTKAALFTPSGSGKIRRAWWSLPVTVDPAGLLGEGAGTGSLLLSVSSGLRADWYGHEGGPVSLASAEIDADGSSLRFAAGPADESARQVFRLWEETGGPGAEAGAGARATRSTVEVSLPRAFTFTFSSHHTGTTPGAGTGTGTGRGTGTGTGTDEFDARGVAHTWLDRPVTAGGTRLDSALPVTYRLFHEAEGFRLALTTHPGGGGAGESQAPLALALTNALLTVTTPDGLRLDGPLAAPDRLDMGELGLSFRLRHLLPTLPDPYAANFRTPALRSTNRAAPAVQARVNWADPAAASLDIRVLPDAEGEADVPAELVPDPEPLPLEVGAREPNLPAEFEEWLGARQCRSGLALLDVSSHSDQLGVTVTLSRQERRVPLSVGGLTLHAEAAHTLVFLLPQFQWEPVRNRANPLTGDEEALLTFAGDGGPTLVGARSDSVTLVPVTPVAVAREVVRAHEEDDVPAAVLCTLPFGMKAVVRLDPLDQRFAEPATLRLRRTHFTGFTGARQIALRAGVPASAGLRPAPLLIGRAWQSATFEGAGPPHPRPDSVLGPLREDFNASFTGEVPLSRIDFGGYGAGVVSRWVNDSPAEVRVSQVTFDGYHGRTAFERIQLTTLLVPCFAVLVRTITLERYGSGAVVRWDSGWTATTPGRFRHPRMGRIGHPGAVRGLFDIREIRDTDVYVEIPASGGGAPVRMQAVRFDTDVEIGGVQEGQGAEGRVPGRGHLGFVQRIPLEQPLADMEVGALAPDQLRELFDSQGPMGGPVDCTVRVGSSPHTMRVHGVYADSAGVNPGTGDEEFAVALYGSPQLPAAGRWSVVRVDNTRRTVGPVDAQRGVPLIQRNNAVSHEANRYPMRWADPRHLFRNSPDSDYAFLYAGESQRVLYPRPRVAYLDANISSPLVPLYADPYTMLRSGGLFPSLSEAMALKEPYPLSLASGRLTFVPDTVTATPGAHHQRLVNTTAWNAEAQYDQAEFTLRTADDWRMSATAIKQRLEFSPVKEILVFQHGLTSPATGTTGFPQWQVSPGKALEPVAEVLDLLRKLVPGVDAAGGHEEQGLPGPLHVSSSFTGTGYRLAAVADFQIQGEQGEGVNCGIGKVRGGLTLGAELVADLLAAEVGGSVFLEIRGSYQQLIFPLIYAGGELRFRIRGDASGTTAVELDACSVGSVGGDLIPGLVELEASVTYGYFIGYDDATSRFRPGIVLGMSGRAMLLSGLLGFSLSVEGRLVLQRAELDPSHPKNAEVRLRGDILVAGTVTVAWAVKKRKSFHTTYDVKVGWETLAVAAKAGILPVP
ncbi:hypothetical protein ABZT27_18850 [Streptomyces sp. NPDC005389]|uniref:hypothetical protein n=1 Tax=Streptomyces sp. NPDC005389 TaxID=3157040 RepID=UPI0033AAEADC